MVFRWLHLGIVWFPPLLIALMHTRVLHNFETPLSNAQVEFAERAHRILLWILACAFISGLFGVYLGYASSGVQYFDNPKLRAKWMVFWMLVLNACLIHKYLMSRIKEGVVLAREGPFRLTLYVVLGSISMSSWAWAYLIGLGRAEWSNTLPLMAFVSGWLLLLLVTFIAGFVTLAFRAMSLLRTLPAQGSTT